MAAPDQVVSFGGQQNAAGAVDQLFLKVWSGEVLYAFREAARFTERTLMRSIASGKSAQFPATWKTTAAYHTPGAFILGNVISGSERVITIDDLLISPVFIASIDEAKAHFEYRSEYSFQTGAALAKQMDNNIGQVMGLAARASATVTGANGGTQIVNATSKTNADSLMASIQNAVAALDEKDVPESDRYIFLYPDQYYLLVGSGSKSINRDYGGEGSIAGGEVVRLFGATVVKTNHMPRTNVASGPAAYQGNFSNTAALVSHRSCVGTVKLMDLATESQYLIQNQGTLIVSKYAVGHGILRPEASVEIVTA